MTEKTANKHEMKTRETRAALLEAAETIFVRDGYEGAELGEIATMAGRTKGAIYAQFKSKEEVFLALVETRALRHREHMETLLAKAKNRQENMEALRTFFRRLAADEGWSLLVLEFKLFALRHPESRRRYKDLYDSFLASTDEPRYVDVLGPAPDGCVSRAAAVATLGPVLSALALETRLDIAPFGEGEVETVAERIFDTLMGLERQGIGSRE